MNSLTPDLNQLRSLLLNAEDETLLEIARKRKRILSLLTALSYDRDAKVSKRAIAATGMAAKVIGERDPEHIRNYVLRLFWLVNDESGGICWRAPELIGEILHHCPQFDQFFPMLISLLDLEKEDTPRFQIGTLWAIGRVAQVERTPMLPALGKVQALTYEDQDSHTRKIALWCLEQLTHPT